MGLRWWRPHQALSRAFEPQADAGWPPPLVSPVSFRRATQTYKAVRRAIQHSQASLRALAKRYGINPKTVAKWKKRGSVAGLPTGPKDAASTVLSIEEEAVIVAFRRHTLLPLDDELCRKLGDGVNQAADLISATASIPSLNFIPLTTFGNWF